MESTKPTIKTERLSDMAPIEVNRMAHTLYQNEVLTSQLNELLISKVDLMKFVTHNNELMANPGDKYTINKYTYTGEAERVAKGAGNTANKYGSLSFTPVSYDVTVCQHTFEYFDEDFYRDPKVVDYGLEGASKVMANQFKKDYFTEAAKASLKLTLTAGKTISYEAVVDAIAKMNLEDGEETGLYLIINPAQKAEVRKDPDFKAVQLGTDSIVISGQIGWISGIPVAVSKACPAKKAYVGFPEAITLFTKKAAYSEGERVAKTRTNSVVNGMVNVMALTDDSKIVEITQA